MQSKNIKKNLVNIIALDLLVYIFSFDFPLIIKQPPWAVLFDLKLMLEQWQWIGYCKIAYECVHYIFMDNLMCNILSIQKLLNRKLCTETTWILQFYQDNASRFQQGWFQLICDKWEDKAISAHHDTLCS